MGDNISARYLVFQGQSIEDSNQLDSLIEEQKSKGVRVEEYSTPLDLYSTEVPRSLYSVYKDNMDYEEVHPLINGLNDQHTRALKNRITIVTDELGYNYNDDLSNLLFENGLDTM